MRYLRPVIELPTERGEELDKERIPSRPLGDNPHHHHASSLAPTTMPPLPCALPQDPSAPLSSSLLATSGQRESRFGQRCLGGPSLPLLSHYYLLHGRRSGAPQKKENVRPTSRDATRHHPLYLYLSRPPSTMIG